MAFRRCLRRRCLWRRFFIRGVMVTVVMVVVGLGVAGSRLACFGGLLVLVLVLVRRLPVSLGCWWSAAVGGGSAGWGLLELAPGQRRSKSDRRPPALGAGCLASAARKRLW